MQAWKAPLEPRKGGMGAPLRVHAGFLHAYRANAVRAPLRDRILELAASCTAGAPLRLYLTGKLRRRGRGAWAALCWLLLLPRSPPGDHGVSTTTHPSPCPSATRVGHSLGGALAVLAGWHIQRLLPTSRVTLYTFGAPKVRPCGCGRGSASWLWAG